MSYYRIIKNFLWSWIVLILQGVLHILLFTTIYLVYYIHDLVVDMFVISSFLVFTSVWLLIIGPAELGQYLKGERKVRWGMVFAMAPLLGVLTALGVLIAPFVLRLEYYPVWWFNLQFWMLYGRALIRLWYLTVPGYMLAFIYWCWHAEKDFWKGKRVRK